MRSPTAKFIENPVCSSANEENIEDEADQDETVDDSEQSWEGEQMLLSTEGIQRAGQSKTAQYVASNRKQIKKIPWQIKRINYFLISKS